MFTLSFYSYDQLTNTDNLTVSEKPVKKSPFGQKIKQYQQSAEEFYRQYHIPVG